MTHLSASFCADGLQVYAAWRRIGCRTTGEAEKEGQFTGRPQVVEQKPSIRVGTKEPCSCDAVQTAGGSLQVNDDDGACLFVKTKISSPARSLGCLLDNNTNVSNDSGLAKAGSGGSRANAGTRGSGTDQHWSRAGARGIAIGDSDNCHARLCPAPSRSLKSIRNTRTAQRQDSKYACSRSDSARG